MHVIEKKYFYRNKTLIFLKVVDTEVSQKISLVEKSYKFFIGYLYNDNKAKPLHIMLPKTSKNVMMDKVNGCIF